MKTAFGCAPEEESNRRCGGTTRKGTMKRLIWLIVILGLPVVLAFFMTSPVNQSNDGPSSTPSPGSTELAPAGPFWVAEPEHQDYLERHPGGYTCHFSRPHWQLED